MYSRVYIYINTQHLKIQYIQAELLLATMITGQIINADDRSPSHVFLKPA
jgi:hypothetical protein